jgi:predicted NBD/HSP70 family sugar kinase
VIRVVGVDLGGTKVQGVVLHGTEVKQDERVETPPGGPDAIVRAIVELVDSLGGTKHADAIGIGVPGAVDHHAGVVRRAPNLPDFGEDVPLASLVADALKVERVVLSNDVGAATVAEHHLGAAKGSDDVLTVFVGTGVGGGLVLGGHAVHGATGAAGEIGHTVVVDGGRPCGCGKSGHVESYAGRACIEREARRRHAAGEPTTLVELAGDGRMKSGVLAKALAEGDAMTIELLDEAVRALGAGIASAVALLDLSLVVVGGGVADKLGPAFVARIEEAVRSRLFLATSPVRVVAAALGDLSGAIGAALVATT